MRVVSMVPSWTETLLRAGVDVVGRTRFCVHPQTQVASIPVVGGTKDWKWDEIEKLNPDLLLLDREENPKFMSEQATIPWHGTHIESVHSMAPALVELSTLLSNNTLNELSQRWSAIAPLTATGSGDRSAISPITSAQALNSIHGVIKWGHLPKHEIQTVLYMIWRNPWMAVSRNTFIGSVLEQLGLYLPQFDSRYPKLDLNTYDSARTLVLFSSEPYPFLKRQDELTDFPFPHAFVDGECFSWFGIRALEFLEKYRSSIGS